MKQIFSYFLGVIIPLIVFLGIAMLFPQRVSAQACISPGMYNWPLSESYTVGDEFNVQITIITCGQDVDRADAVIRYDPLVLLPVSLTPNTPLFGSWPVNSIEYGVIKLSGASTPDIGLLQSGVTVIGDNLSLGLIRFRAVGIGTTTLILDYTPGSLTDCNLMVGASDVIGGVANSTFIVTEEGQPPAQLPDTAVSPIAEVIFWSIIVFGLFSGATAVMRWDQLLKWYRSKDNRVVIR